MHTEDTTKAQLKRTTRSVGAAHLVPNRDIDRNGLCAYSDPETWFDYRKAAEAKRICANCPLRKACARAALDLQVVDGVWAGVNLPGEHATIDELAAARRQLAFIADAMDHQPEHHRLRSLAIREAIHHTAFSPNPAAVVTESASA